MAEYALPREHVEQAELSFNRLLNRGIAVIVSFFSSFAVQLISSSAYSGEIFILILLLLVGWSMVDHAVLRGIRARWERQPGLYYMEVMLINLGTLTAVFIIFQQAIAFVQHAWTDGDINAGESLALLYTSLIFVFVLYIIHESAEALPPKPPARPALRPAPSPPPPVQPHATSGARMSLPIAAPPAPLKSAAAAALNAFWNPHAANEV